MPPDLPLRKLRILVDAILGELDEQLASSWRSSVDPARAHPARMAVTGGLQRAQRMASDGAAQLQPAVPLFVGLNIGDPVWNYSTFSFNRQQLFD